MAERLNVLLVEDSEDDALLVERALRQAGLEVVTRRVDTREAMNEALAEQPWDVILSDFSMPAFSGFDAHDCLQKSGLDIPFILVSGKIGEQIAVELMRSGAHDYVAKDKLARLAPAIERELREAEGRRQRAVAEEHLRISKARYQAMFTASEVSIWDEDFSGVIEMFEQLRTEGVTDLGAYLDAQPEALSELAGRVRINSVNPATHELMRASDQAQLLAGLPKVFTEESFATFREEMIALWEGRESFQAETTQLTLDGELLYVVISMPLPSDPDALRHVPVSILDISERKHAEQALLRSNRALETLSACNELLIRGDDEQHLLCEICRIVVEVGGFRMAWVGRVEEMGGQVAMRPLAVEGADDGFLDQTHLRDGLPLHPELTACRAVVACEPCVISDIEAGPEPDEYKQLALRHRYRSVISLPLRVGAEMFGALTIFSEQVNGFDAREVELLVELSNDLAFGLGVLQTRREHNREMLRVERNLVETIRTIALTIEKRDPYTAGHQQRVAQLARSIGEAMGLDGRVVEGIYLGGLIHDIGKVYVPSEILSRPGKVNHVELELIKTHPEVGYEIVAGIDFPWPVAEMVHSHHERLDGSGYPRGLAGDQLIIEARILAVADVVEAMSSHRPYRAALGIEAGLDEIEAHSGMLYDSGVVEACCRLIRGKGFEFDVNQRKI